MKNVKHAFGAKVADGTLNNENTNSGVTDVNCNGAGGTNSAGFIVAIALEDGQDAAVALIAHTHTSGTNGYTDLHNTGQSAGGVTISLISSGVRFTQVGTRTITYLVRNLNLCSDKMFSSKI